MIWSASTSWAVAALKHPLRAGGESWGGKGGVCSGVGEGWAWLGQINQAKSEKESKKG